MGFAGISEKGGKGMRSYEPPVVVATYSAEELRLEAAQCSLPSQAPSDRNLKTAIRKIEQPLAELDKTGRS
jgi:hypothetical protein